MIKDFNKSKIRVLTTLIMVWSTAVYAQQGDYFLSHQNPGNHKIQHINFDIAHDNNGVLCIANREGVLQFDGVQWEVFPTPAAVFTIKVSEDNTIYIGGRLGFGRLVQNGGGAGFSYESLYENDASIGDIFDLELKGNTLYALNEQEILSYKIDEGKEEAQVQRIRDQDSGSLYGIFRMSGLLYVSSEKKGLLRITEKGLVPASIRIPEEKVVLFIEKDPVGERYLIGTRDNDLYLYENNALRAFQVQDDGYIKGSEMVDAKWLKGGLIAVGTLKGGVVFFDIASGKVEQIINYHTGLPDNEVYAMARDRDNGLWVSHDQGFTRISPHLPFRSFSRFPGLEGNLLSVQPYQDNLYVSTSQGVYYLDEVKNYKDVIYYVRKTPSIFGGVRGKKGKSGPNKETQVPDSGNKNTAPKKRLKKKKSGLFSFMRKKKNPTKEEEKEEESADEKEVLHAEIKKSRKNKGKRSDKVEARIRRELQSIKYVYKKVKGINAKTFQILHTQGRLLSSGLDGIHEIKGTQATAVYPEPVRYLYASDSENLIMASTYSGSIEIFTLEKGVWKSAESLEGFKGYIQHIVEDKEHYWLSSTDYIYKIKLNKNDGSLESLQEYDLKNPYFDHTYGVYHEDKVYFVNAGGYYFYNEGTDQIEYLDPEQHTSFAAPSEYLYGSGNKLWSFVKGGWGYMGNSAKTLKNLKVLSLFEKINYIHYDISSKNFWVISPDNELYRFKHIKDLELASNYALFLKEIRSPGKAIHPKEKFEIEQSESSLTFEFVHPDFSGILGIEYQYQLKGLHENWSEWGKKNNVIHFSYLPTGKYELLVKTRNIFGQETSIDPIKFSVVPPYWKRPWFYALEVLFFGALMFLSIVLNKNDSPATQILSRLLGLLTLIIIVEFVQTVTESWFANTQSPVIDFIIHVSIALLVLPLERKLRKFFFKEPQGALIPEIEIPRVVRPRKKIPSETGDEVQN